MKDDQKKSLIVVNSFIVVCAFILTIANYCYAECGGSLDSIEKIYVSSTHCGGDIPHEEFSSWDRSIVIPIERPEMNTKLGRLCEYRKGDTVVRACYVKSDSGDVWLISYCYDKKDSSVREMYKCKKRIHYSSKVYNLF